MSKHIITKVAAVLAISSLGVLVLAGSASAAPPGTSETITEMWSSSYFPPGPPPLVATYTGSFTASGTVGDAGSLTLTELFAAVGVSSVSVTPQVQTLTGTQGTLTLQCTLFANDFSNPADVPSTGTCAVLSGTGTYALLKGSGKVTGYYNLTVFPQKSNETIVIPAS